MISSCPFALASALVVALAPAWLHAQPAADAPHQHGTQTHEHHAEATATLCAICPAARESAATSWQPDVTTIHQRVRSVGAWQLVTHAQLALVQTNERGPRGDSQLFSTSHAMAQARRPLGSGVFGVRTMLSLEPTMGRDGYPLLLQTGETADGVTPLVDRQHPHDFPMEVAATYARPLANQRAFYVYAALAGSPALGPPPFMHRASASRLPLSPITHHWFDATHITYGVLTAGLVASPAVKLEGSVFRGREPDERRWGLERPTLDSVAFRLSVNPTPSLALQVSAATLEEPEQLHPGQDVVRITASGLYARQWDRIALDATVAWGRNKRSTSVIPAPGGMFVFPGTVTYGTLVEATVHVARRHRVISRLELVHKDELFGLTDPRHSTVYPLTRLTAGYVLDVVTRPGFTIGAGVAGSHNRLPSDLQGEYGGSPGGLLAFIDLMTH